MPDSVWTRSDYRKKDKVMDDRDIGKDAKIDEVDHKDWY